MNEPVYRSTVAEFSEQLLEQLPQGAAGRLTYRGNVKHVLLIAFPAGGGTFRVTIEDDETARAAEGRGRLRKRRPRP